MISYPSRLPLRSSLISIILLQFPFVLTISLTQSLLVQHNRFQRLLSAPFPTRRKSDAGNKTISLPSSRVSRKRSDSNVTAGVPECHKADLLQLSDSSVLNLSNLLPLVFMILDVKVLAGGESEGVCLL
ncbi:uncharacterized protein EDB91DRAFT_1107013 [Suillus paluster]|uniref:uncharacterized protein n=1 Tax=Suillus paluster TaxID=48578 RepID=UPI001B8733E3|nr:uncharacterized protein EDB91DRAFT_1107013 [Suillus paluster]KAG1750374.1 hypothetical protein EDB91DRAFT_1107013 [Suillus paluster]